MRYIDADYILPKLIALRDGCLYERNYKAMDEAIKCVKQAKTLKDPMGNNYGYSLRSALDEIEKLRNEKYMTEMSLYAYQSGQECSPYKDLQDENALLRKDNILLRDAYRELREERDELQRRLDAND